MGLVAVNAADLDRRAVDEDLAAGDLYLAEAKPALDRLADASA